MNVAGEAAASVRTAGARRPTVLIVEDEAVVARDLQRSLLDMGYDVIGCAASSGEALQAMAMRTPDVVLMDIRIKGELDGIETAGLLRARFRVPIIYLTAYADEQTVTRAAHSEPYGYIIKPFTSREVRSAIEIARYKYAIDARMAERERWFSTILRSIGDGIVACDPQQRVQFMNDVAERLTGWSEQEAVGRQLDEIVRITDGDHVDVESLVGKALADRTVQVAPADRRLLARDGALACTIDDAAAPIIADGTLLGAVLVFRDVTEQQRMRDQVVLSERLASLGTLAAGMCHEINNPLTFIIANAHFLETAIESWQTQLRNQGSFELADRTWKAREALDDLREGAERIRRIVADLSVFGRPFDEPSPAVDVRDSIAWALRVSATQMRTRARVVNDVEPVPPVRASETRLAQVVINLLINAAHAISEGDAEHNTIRVSTATDDQNRVLIRVQDSGGGIPPHVLPRIFEPFFTTKHPGVGSGLGLSICHGIVESFGGEIRVQSTLGEGTTFEVALPPAPLVSVPPPEGASEQAAARTGRVLIVDDEPNVLRAVEALLLDQHDVVAVEDARAALTVILRGDHFDVVLCDVVMPGFNGMDLYERVAQFDAALAGRFVFVTGGAFTPRTTTFLAAVPNARIEKPFDPPLLRALLQRMIAASQT
jgi:PAS domain S-box-containing protein